MMQTENTVVEAQLLASFRKHLPHQAETEADLFQARVKKSMESDLVPANLLDLLKRATDSHPEFPMIGFNSQLVRAGLFLAMMREMPFDVFVETGTYMGGTCFLVAAQTPLAVRSCDLPQRRQPIASILSDLFEGRIQLAGSDSREFLAEFFDSSRFTRPFFYLDAHWEEEIPLRDELELILTRQEELVIVIDDFRVPHDPGFGFDTYEDITLEWAYIADVIGRSGKEVEVFYPGYSSQIETGWRRGFVLIASKDLGAMVRNVISPGLLRSAKLIRNDQLT